MVVAVALSGGSDSLYALIRLLEQGEDVLPVHGRFLPLSRDSERVEQRLAEICASHDLPFHVLDLVDEFDEQVISPFVNEYLAGRTPNPCARCNAVMKFGLLADAAGDLGADEIATGHYAFLEDHPAYGRTLRVGSDLTRDQSYFLSLIPRERLYYMRFPLGDMHKEQLRLELAKRELVPPLPAESREICFVPYDDYRAFLLDQVDDPPGPGPMLLRDGTHLGEHEGLWNYTPGQRRGLGIPYSEPLYVLHKDISRNALIVGVKDELTADGLSADPVNFLVDYDLWPEDVLVKTRYKQNAHKAWARPDETGLVVSFPQPRTPPAPGQIATIYDKEGYVLAGGVITA